jgi:hypothetical protein
MFELCVECKLSQHGVLTRFDDSGKGSAESAR